MAIYIDVTLNGGSNRARYGAGQPRDRTAIPRHTITVELDKREWRFKKPLSPFWRYIAPSAMGTWYKDMTGAFVLRDASKNEVLHLWSSKELGGKANYWLNGNRFEGEGRWRPSAVPLPKSWAGLMIKGGGGAVVSAEGGIAGVMQLWGDTSQGCTFTTRCGRLGAVAGVSGGLAFVYATGFSKASDYQDFSSDGMDFALAVGTKLGGLLKPQWTKACAALGKFDGGAAMVEGIVKGTNPKFAALRNELPGIAKSISSGMLIDTDAKNITVLDIPLCGAGAELGIFYGWSRTSLVSSW